MGKEGQCRVQNTALLGSVVRLAQRTAAIEASGGGARRGGTADEAAPAGERGGDAVDFQSTGYQSNGLNAQWSSGDEQCAIHFFGLGDSQNVGDGLAKDAADIGLIATVADNRG